MDGDAIEQEALTQRKLFSQKKIHFINHQSNQSYSDDLPEEAEDEMLAALAEDMRVHIDHMAADGLGRIDGQRLERHMVPVVTVARRRIMVFGILEFGISGSPSL